MSFRSVKRQTTFSLIGFFLSLALTVFLYTEMREELANDERPVQISRGLQRYLLRHPSGKCLGWLSYKISEDGGYSLVADTTIFYLLREQNHEVVFSCGVSFNSLNQMSGIYIKIINEKDDLRLQALGVQELTVTLEGRLGGRERRFVWSMPGPIELFERKEGQFILKAPNAPHVIQLFDEWKMPMSAAELPFTLLPVHSQGDIINEETAQNRGQGLQYLRQQCFELGIHHLEMDRYLSLLNQLGVQP